MTKQGSLKGQPHSREDAVSRLRTLLGGWCEAEILAEVALADHGESFDICLAPELLQRSTIDSRVSGR